MASWEDLARRPSDSAKLTPDLGTHLFSSCATPSVPDTLQCQTFCSLLETSMRSPCVIIRMERQRMVLEWTRIGKKWLLDQR